MQKAPKKVVSSIQYSRKPTLEKQCCCKKLTLHTITPADSEIPETEFIVIERIFVRNNNADCPAPTNQHI
jgi:hypothetical protein